MGKWVVAASLLLFLSVSVPLTVFGAITTDLQYGSRGPQVTELQDMLIARGFLSGKSTGVFATLTKRAVVAFQKTSGLPTTGYVGAMTRMKLSSGAKGKQNIPKIALASQKSAPQFSLGQIPFYVEKNTWFFSSTSAVQFPVAKRPPPEDFVDATQIQERPVDPKTVVLVRCKYIGTYLGDTKGTPPTPEYATGSGVVVSPDGYILTAAHILRDQEINIVNKQYETYSIDWKRDSCEVAFTDGSLTPIYANAVGGDNSIFRAVQIVFEPTEIEYNPLKFEDPTTPGKILYAIGGSDLDFALLKVDGKDLPYAPVIGKLLYFNAGEALLGLGYPGLVVSMPQHLERIDTKFNGYVWDENSSCVTRAVVQKCGITYQGKRYKADYEKLYEKSTPLGKYTSFFRGGFSGGPLFYKGHVAGIIGYGKENEYSNLRDLGILGPWNWVNARASSEIILTLKEKGITLPSVP